MPNYGHRLDGSPAPSACLYQRLLIGSRGELQPPDSGRELKREERVTEQTTELEKRVDHLLSHAAITRLLTDSCRMVDAREPALVAPLWHADAIWEAGEPFGELRGIEAISEALRHQMWPSTAYTLHAASNITVDIDGLTAKVTADICATVRTLEDRWLQVLALYEDTVSSVEGEWKLQHRRGTVRAVIQLDSGGTEVT